MQIILIIFGVILILWGRHLMKTEDALFGKTQKCKNIFNLIMLGQASGVGQFVSGILCIVVALASFVIEYL